MSESYPAQFGEDRDLEARFAGRTAYYLEIGAGDGYTFSNTYRLEQIGWIGLLVEANPDLVSACSQARPRSRTVHCAAVAPGGPSNVKFQIAKDNDGLSALEITPTGRRMLTSWTGRVVIEDVTVPARTLDSILDDDPPPQVNVASIDVEGHEATVLRGFDLRRWRPEVVIVERNRRLPDREVMRILHRSGYRFQRTTGVNDWFTPGRASSRYRARLFVCYYLPKLAAAVKARTVRRLTRHREQDA